MNQYLDYMTLAALPEKLLKHYEKSHTGADTLTIGHSYFRGEKGKTDYEKAITYYLAAAEKGMSDACFVLGLCYQQEKGVPEDSEQADYYFRRAFDLKKQQLCKVMGLENNRQSETKKNLLNRDFRKILSVSGRMSRIRQIVFSKRITQYAFAYYRKDISENGDGSVIGWIEDATLHIESNGIVEAPKDCGELFAHLENVYTIEFNNVFDTGLTENMNGMFLCCKSLIELETKGFDTSQVKTMSSMFQSCSNLTQLYLSGFDTSRVEDMSSMFKDCRKLIKLDVNRFDTGHVKNMAFMFRGCRNLTKLDLSGFDTSQVKKMAFMFKECRRLTEIELSEKFNTEQVEDMSYMFSECKMLKFIDTSHFPMNNADRNNIFAGCDALLLKIIDS